MLATGCAATSDGSGDVSSPDAHGDADVEIIAADPLAMPKPLVTFLRTQSSGPHHLEWHTVRQWDRLNIGWLYAGAPTPQHRWFVCR